MKTKIEVGKKYKNRDGVVMSVVEEYPIESNYRERFWVVDETKNRYYYPEYTDGYAVNDFGGFGTYPNQRDLVEELTSKGYKGYTTTNEIAIF